MWRIRFRQLAAGTWEPGAGIRLSACVRDFRVDGFNVSCSVATGGRSTGVLGANRRIDISPVNLVLDLRTNPKPLEFLFPLCSPAGFPVPICPASRALYRRRRAGGWLKTTKMEVGKEAAGWMPCDSTRQDGRRRTVVHSPASRGWLRESLQCGLIRRRVAPTGSI